MLIKMLILLFDWFTAIILFKSHIESLSGNCEA